MRDPELVFKAQLAASALERAWQRWRVMHGLVADPMPAISSYVGYSLEEPWGQPRVVFGLSANDAEQLSALLNRHDCIGPVHARITGQQGREITAGASRPLPVPPQAPSVVAEQSSGGDSRAPGRAHDKARRQDAAGPEPDGPVYRQVARAAREAARQAAAQRTPAGQEPTEQAPAGRAGTAATETVQPGAGQAGTADAEVVPAEVAQSETEQRAPVQPEVGQARSARSAAGQPGIVAAKAAPAAAATAETAEQHPSPHASTDAAAVTEPQAAAEAPAAEAPSGEALAGDAPAGRATPDRPVPDQGQSGPGPDDRREAGRRTGLAGDPTGPPAGNSARDDKGDDDPPDPGGSGGSRRSVPGMPAGRARSRSRGSGSRASYVAGERPGGDARLATSGSGVHSVAEGSGPGTDADSGVSEDPGADVHNSNARAETRDASARAAEARAADANAAEARAVEAGDAAVTLATSHGTEDQPGAAPAGETAQAGPEAASEPASPEDAGSTGASGIAAVVSSPAQAADGAGPLALAASAARVAAEARIRAAMRRNRSSAMRPEAASGAQLRLPGEPLEFEYEDYGDVASAWGGPELGAEQSGAPEVVALRPRQDDADYDADEELELAADERPEHSPSGYVRRNRITRGYSIPRLSRSKRPGAVPGL